MVATVIFAVMYEDLYTVADVLAQRLGLGAVASSVWDSGMPAVGAYGLDLADTAGEVGA